MNLNLLLRAIRRAYYIRTHAPYEKFLRSVSQQDDAWVVSQGKYILWWQQRASSDFRISLSNGTCHVTTSLSNGIIEVFPNEFYSAQRLTFPYPHSSVDGPVIITIDEKLKQKDMLKEALQREGILNYMEGSTGELFLSTEVQPILEDMASSLRRSDLECFHQCIVKVRQLIIERLGQKGLPLIRIWYHPHIDGKIVKMVISPRYDVERAITNMPRIWELEHIYNASSTVHLRPYCPFYSQSKIREITKHTACPEIALHAEFVGHASRFGGVLEAAIAEKKKLEEIIGHEVLGLSLHGGRTDFE